MTPITRPVAGEYAPYYETYFAQLPAGADLLTLLREQPAALRHILTGVTDQEAGQPTAPGKWSIKQILSHLVDCERVFAYRALAIARGEQQPLPGFDQDDYVRQAHVDRPVTELLAEHAAQRAATLALLQGLAPDAFQRKGTAAGQPVSVRALAWVIAAHEEHHHQLLRRHLHPAP